MLFCSPQVSIPYRLATNYGGKENTKHEKKFQFLIGWLQTTYHFMEQPLDDPFQFLIGWLQTISCWLTQSQPMQVSIPYRLATNGSSLLLLLW